MASGIRRKKRNLKTGGLKVDISKTAQAKPITFYDRLKTREGLGECIVLEQQYSCKPDTFATDRDEIGQGHYGVVCKMLHEPSQTIMAVKEVSITTADPKSHEHLLNDLDVVRQARHDNIVRYFGFDYHEDTLRIMLECCLCDWRHILDRAGATNQTIPEPIVARFAHSVTSGLVYLHQQLNTMHRDVKPSNVLLASDGLIKLCDFGICKVVEDPSRLSDIKTVVGCNVYLPPERIKGATSYDSRSDVWSLGVTLLRLTTLFDFPFPSSNPTGLYALMQFLSEDPGFEEHVPEDLHEDMKSFMLSCLTYEVDDRPQVSPMLLEHALFAADEDEGRLASSKVVLEWYQALPRNPE